MGITIRIENGEEKTAFTAEERAFKSGNRGYLVNGTAIVNGKKYKCNLRLIESIPKAVKMANAAKEVQPSSQAPAATQ